MASKWQANVFFVFRVAIRKRLISQPWHVRGPEFEFHQVHQTFQTLTVNHSLRTTPLVSVWRPNAMVVMADAS